MGVKRAVLDIARRTGVLRAVGATFGSDRLTVLAYHRITDHTDPAFSTYAGNVSAGLEEFARQMDWVSARFQPVGIDDVAAAVEGRASLPKRPLLVTFDDGYADNHESALPILRERGIPAALFLTTDVVGTRTGFWWDRAAWCFRNTQQIEADLPGIGPASWESGDTGAVARRWIEAMKVVPEDRKLAALGDLPAALGVSVPDDAFDGLVLTWDEVRAMTVGGVAMEAHTLTHPILTRVGPDEARRQIEGSRDRVEAETGRRPVGLAYPNGQPGDVDEAVRSIVAEAGFSVAFTLAPGPARHREVVADPLMIRRIYVHRGDGLHRFAAKVHGLARGTARLR